MFIAHRLNKVKSVLFQVSKSLFTLKEHIKQRQGKKIQYTTEQSKPDRKTTHVVGQMTWRPKRHDEYTHLHH